MKTKAFITHIVKILLPFVIGGIIIWWMYRGFDFSIVHDTLMHGMNWGWMLFSLIFGITAEVFRGLRWRQSLEPLGEYPKTSNCIHAVFISYASSLVIPRSGEVARCGVLKKYDSVSFSKSLGTVVTERVIDSLLIAFIALIVFLLQIHTFSNFFTETGTNFVSWLNTFTTTGWIVTLCCIVISVVFIYILLKRATGESRLKKIITDLKAGIFSLKDVKNKYLFIFYTLAIWASYFLHFYIAFFSFEFMSGLSLLVALVAFIIGSIAVIVPTPNGMGPWHFAVKTILILYGVASTQAEIFVMIVWVVQTALIPLLGVYSLLCLGLKHKHKTL